MAGIVNYKPPAPPPNFYSKYKPYTPPKPAPYKPYQPRATMNQPGGTTAGLTNDTGYTGPSVQDLINQGKIGWNQGMGNIGYTAPNFGSSGNDQTGGGGDDVDWSGFISGDWEVQEAETAMASQMARARGDYRADIRRAFVELGLPDTAQIGKEYSGEIDAETIKQAAANKYSMMAQIAQTAERSRATNNAALAARGILSSGATTKAQTDVSAGAEQNRYQGLQGFLSGALQGRRGLADMEFQLARGVAQARSAAAQRAAEWAYLHKKQPGTANYPFAGLPGSNDYDYSGIPSSDTWLTDYYGSGFNPIGGDAWLKAAKKATGQRK